ncbi:MAG TPA: 3-hydroxyacyl-ACP dehydratase FabZ [Rhizomicrobium sp.]|jgi:3-hydroxyacyl-[acyl-carrier-protein] dehydratase|nr:3-hydroxyacyl-ACP dehydratase FabZ [Rhizomicrobium sp.]
MADTQNTGEVLTVEDIKKLLPHRPPFLLIDRLAEMVLNESAVAYKAVTITEPHFQGHFPDHAVMPGVLIVEAMAQAAGALVMHSLGLAALNRIVYFMGIDKARFRKPVTPGDMLRIPVRALQKRGPVWRFAGEAYVGDTLCAEAEYTAMISETTRDEDANSSKRNR